MEENLQKVKYWLLFLIKKFVIALLSFHLLRLVRVKGYTLFLLILFAELH